MKVGIVVEMRHLSRPRYYQSSPLLNFSIRTLMDKWLVSSERENLISLDIPFLFIGGVLNQIAADGSVADMVVIDIDHRHIGLVKMVSGEVRHLLSDAGRLIDLRLNQVRKRYGLPDEQGSDEIRCSYKRRFYLYRVNSHFRKEEV